MPEWIDMSFPASEHLYASPLVENIRTIDPEMADNYQGVTLGKLGANRLVVTHSHHNRNYGPSEYLFPMEFDTFLADTLEDNFTSLELKLKTGFEEEVGKIIQPLQEDEKPLIGISTYMGAKPETALDGDICNFLPWMEALSKHLAEKYEARILFCGDFLPQRAWSKFTDTTFVDVNNLTQNPYFQIEIMRRTQWFLGTWSPFWESVNLMRTPADTPAIQLLTSPLVYQGRVRPETRNYYTIGGRWDLPYVQATFRHPILKDWIDKRSFDTDSITDIMDNLQANSKSDNTG
jgi:hypothetical protein